MKPYKYARIFSLQAVQSLSTYKFTPQDKSSHENEIWQANFTLLAKFIKLAYLSYLCRKRLSSASTNQPVI